MDSKLLAVFLNEHCANYLKGRFTSDSNLIFAAIYNKVRAITKSGDWSNCLALGDEP